MDRRKKEELSPSERQEEHLRVWEARLEQRERELDARDEILAEMPSGDLSSIDVKNWFAKTRKSRLAAMLTIATKSDNEKTRRDMLLRLDDMDVGKPGAKKRTDADEVEGVIINHGMYGVQ